MRECRKCKKDIPMSVVIGGIRRSLQNRKFCLGCSPYGSHNTKKALYDGKKKCCDCGKILPLSEFCKKGDRLHSKCKKCLYLYQMRRWNKRKVKAIDYLGGSCRGLWRR